MTKQTQATSVNSNNLESAMAKLRGLSREFQSAVISIIDRLAMALPKAEKKAPRSTEAPKKGGKKTNGNSKKAVQAGTDPQEGN